MASTEDYADFRILARCPSGSKKNLTSCDSSNGIVRYRFTLGEVLSWNIDIDVIVGNGWTRITLKEIPRFIVNAFDLIMAEGLQLDGIFRKEGNSARLNRPEVQEVYRGIRAIPSDFTVPDVCTMIKRFLKDLKPTLLNSEGLRFKLIERAKKAKLSGDFILSHQDIVRMFETSAQLPPAHIGTLAYVMRLLSRIAKHSESHKMTTDNLAVVLVGSVFGEFMTGGGTESRKKMQQAKKCTEAEIHAKKEDMAVQVAAVKLLIVNANLIALPKSHYVSSNRLHGASHSNARSTSAMPNIRCASVSERDRQREVPSYGSSHVFSMAKASLNQQRSITRRDSDLTHLKSFKQRGEPATTKRSSSFLPIASLRGLRDKVHNQFLKRNKSPSPEKPGRAVFNSDICTYSPFSSVSSPPTSRRLASEGAESESEQLLKETDQRSGVCAPEDKGSTSSGRKSRTHAKKGNINSVMRSSNRNSGSQKSFRMSPMTKRTSGSSSTNSTLTCNSVGRCSQTDRNNFLRKSIRDVTPPQEKKKRSSGGRIIRRNTADDLRASTKHTGNGITRRSTFWGVDTITEEKENPRRTSEKSFKEEKGVDVLLLSNGVGESVLEMMNHQARLRRVGVAERRRRLANSRPSDSMMVLNGSMATFDKPPAHEKKVSNSKEKDPTQKKLEAQTTGPFRSNLFSSPGRAKDRFKSSESTKASTLMLENPKSGYLEREMKQQRLDVVATPMLSRRAASESIDHRARLPPPPPPPLPPMSAIPLKHLDSIGMQENGRVWVGKAQTIISSPISVTGRKMEKEKVSPILARSPVFRSPSTVLHESAGKKQSPSVFRSKSHLTENRLFSKDYSALATPPRDRRKQHSPLRPHSNLIYFTPKVERREERSPLARSPYRPILRSASSLTASTVSPAQRNSVDDAVFKCPFLPPMRSHEAKRAEISNQHQTPRGNSRESSIAISDNSELGFGDYNELLKTATEETKFPHQPVEARPSVTMIRSSHCGLVQSRINHFQDIERSHRVSTDLSSSGGRHSVVSQTSLKSIETVSSGGRM